GDLGLMYFASIEPADGKLVRLDMVPMQVRRFRLSHASGKDARWLRDVLNREGERFGKFGSGVEIVGDTLVLRWTGQPG
ncbi:MAG: poly-gamma-glutamate biosynthesis protein, partial [Betaproteobacteria bacterium]|nr:poly-gamma-glutamate biosynthesis protein [Betaproteobacteria bacterium]